MNLINDLDTEIAFAVLVEKKHNEKIESKDVLPLIGRLNKALEEISEADEDKNAHISNDNLRSQTAIN
jgi:hypothetical protein